MFARNAVIASVFAACFSAPFDLGLALPATAHDRPLWVRQLASEGEDYAGGVATDRDGNVYIAGHTSGSLGGPNQGFWDAFIAKYTPAGALRWVQQYGTAESELVRGGLTTDRDGNVYIAGGSYPFAFVARYSPEGELRWSREIDGQDFAEGIATDSDSNLYVVGWSMAGIQWAWAAKYSADGTLLWIKELSWIRGYDSGATGVATDHDGNVYIAGFLRTAVEGDTDGWIAKYSAAGILRWKRYVKSLGTPDDSNEDATSIATDGNGNVYVGGYTGGDAFIAKYSGGGVLRWRRHLTDGFSGQELATDEEANVYITGGFGSTAYVAKYSAAGALRWKRQPPDIPGGEGEAPTDVASDGANNVYIAGYVWAYSHGGQPDAWLAKYSARR